ncbi:unnamed protein product, partial [marine sediment metagenome]
SGSDIRTFEVIVEMDMDHARQVLAASPNATGEGSRLRPGMSAKAEIDVATLTDVLYVPVYVVDEDRGEHLCYVLEDGQPVLREIEIGLNNPTHVHVKAGLKEGDRVLRYDPKRASRRRRTTTQPGRRRAPRGRPTTQAAAQPASGATTQPARPSSPAAGAGRSRSPRGGPRRGR